jgi:hypothetical protein
MWALWGVTGNSIARFTLRVSRNSFIIPFNEIDKNSLTGVSLTPYVEPSSY